MALTADRKITTPKRGPTCRLCLAMSTMTEDDRRILRGWLDHPVLSARQISDWLADDGVIVPRHSVERHRRGDCHESRRVD